MRDWTVQILCARFVFQHRHWFSHIIINCYYYIRCSVIAWWLVSCLMTIGTCVRFPGPPNIISIFSIQDHMQVTQGIPPYASYRCAPSGLKPRSNGLEWMTTMYPVNTCPGEVRSQRRLEELGHKITSAPPFRAQTPLGLHFFFCI